MNLKRPLITLALAFASCMAHAGQPLHQVLMLRSIEVLRFEAVTDKNAAELSSFIRTPSRTTGLRPTLAEVAGGVPGFLVEGLVRRQRDLSFPPMGGGAPVKDSAWTDADKSVSVKFFVAAHHADASKVFVPGQRVNIVLSQKAECDTYPPAGICIFDHPMRLVDASTWAKYGE